MADHCPTCGRPWPSPIKTADQLISLMRLHSPARDVYLAEKGGYFVTYQGGRIEKGVISDALDRGLIIEKFPGKGHEYWKLADA